MRKEEETSKGKYPWLKDMDERRYMMDREILDKNMNLDNSCLNKVEKTQVRNLLYKYKDAFSLRYEIGLCPNIKIEIDVTDKSPFFISPFHANEEDKIVLDKEMKWLCYLGILKEGFSTYSSPVILISRKMTNDKRVVTDFRHLNMLSATLFVYKIHSRENLLKFISICVFQRTIWLTHFWKILFQC